MAVHPTTGTINCVALNEKGEMSGVTTTSGLSWKIPGRVGDSPIPGAGTWADDMTCAVSATGDGELFLRVAFAHEVHARMRYQRDTLEDGCAYALGEVSALGGTGGCVAVDSRGNVALPCTTEAMFRGWNRPGDEPHTGLDAARPTA